MTKTYNHGDRSYLVEATAYSGPASELVETYQGELSGTFTRYEMEFDRDIDALNFVRDLLEHRVVNQARIIGWQHVANLPGALPPVKAQSLSMTTYRLVNNELVANPVDIFGVNY